MKRWGWYLAIAVLVYLLYSGQGDPIDGAVTLLNEITRGSRLTHAPINAVGVVDQDPQSLADSTDYELEAYALGRMLSSEEGNSDNTTKAAVCWCTRNEAARRGTSISALLLHAKNPDHSGYFGSQKDKDPASANFGGSDRYASTALDPYDGDCQIASGVLDGSIPDLTNGAQQFDRPDGEKNPDKVAATRQAAGAVLVSVEGADPGLRFWRT